MLQELVPAFEGRQGGYTRIIKLANRRGDNAPMAQLSLVLDGAKKPATETKATAKTTAKLKTEAKTEAKGKDKKAEATK
jgi:large subunit ribosomal protein L17